MEKLYLLSGKARSGKDTVTQIIKNYYKNKKVILLHYGFYPKNYVQLITGWSGSDEDKPRDFLNEIAMKAREVNPNYMVRRMEEDINILKDYADIIIITDARMEEEMEMPKKFKETVTIRIERPNFESPLTKKQQNHIVENALNNYHKYDYVISNDGDLDDLKTKVERILK